ncbi:alpha/beta hydrolase [Nocardioides sp. CN2-186]|uniref:alpha/beta fold hydrolase n=1 Tax=Nocardioides tweenelious TaxID=3156607 RepID=UPI0032B38632
MTSSELTRAWAERGRRTTWEGLEVYTQTRGHRGRPALLFVHGYPTSSYDFHRVADLLEDEFFLCLVDLPGYGLSDKPRDHRYTIADDVRLVDELVRTTFALDELTLVTHDRGDSVGLALLDHLQRHEAPYAVTGLVVLNGNVWLPLAQLTGIQKALLNPVTGPVVSRLLPARVFARGLARKTCTPMPDAAEVAALEGMLAHQGGMRVQHRLIQYLDERKAHESAWLAALGRSTVPTTLIWGGLDTIAPTRVADHVWETQLRDRPTPAAYWRVPAGNHYVQLDQPEVVAGLLRLPAGSVPDRDVPGAVLRPRGPHGPGPG